MRQLTLDDYENLLAFRVSLRRFLHWSETRARTAGLTPAQHQLLLAVKGHRGEHGPTISDLAGYLMLRHHSAVELVDRAEAGGLVERRGDDADRRVTRVRLTAEGEARLTRLAPAHLDELQNLAPVLDKLVIEWTGPLPAGAAAAPSAAGPSLAARHPAERDRRPGKERAGRDDQPDAHAG